MPVNYANPLTVEAVEKVNPMGRAETQAQGMMRLMEPTEITEYSEQMKEAGNKHMMRVSLIISILAALVATVTVLGHREHTEAILLQSQAGDQWQQYQSHTMRVLQLQTEVKLLSDQPSSDNTKVQSDINDDQAQIAKWKKSEADEMKTAREFGADVKQAEDRASRFDLGEALLQIAVVLASITLLTRHHRYVIVGSVLGAAGVIVTVSAFLLR